MIATLQIGLIVICVVGVLLGVVYWASRARKGAMTFKQAVFTIAVAAILWVPMMTFLIWFSDGLSPRLIGAIGLVNMVVGVTLLTLAWRKWIRNIK